MQTFLPYLNFIQSASCLDNRRLGKQRVEAWQIYKTLTVGSRWKHHPAVIMWKGYEGYLLLYGYTICKEWVKRGFKDSMLNRFINEMYKENIKMDAPPWLGKESFHSKHRSILLAKNYDWYRQFDWKEKPAIQNNGRWPYEWPVNRILE